MKEVQNFFRPELFNRLDQVIPFLPLDKLTVRNIVRREIDLINGREGIKYRNTTFEITDTALDYLCEQGYDAFYDARQMQRTLREELLIPLARKLNKYEIVAEKYHLQFFITQAILAGIFISFLMQGYDLVSVILSTIFQFLTYWFAFCLFKDWEKDNRKHKTLNYSVKFIKTGLIALVISSFGTWGLAVIGAKGMAGTSIYDLALYFYLHFQYNGWFTFSILGLFIKLLENNRIEFSKKYATNSHRLLTFSLFPAYLLSALGKNPGGPVVTLLR